VPLCVSNTKKWKYIILQLHFTNRQRCPERCFFLCPTQGNNGNIGQAKITCKVKNYSYSYKHGRKDIVISKNTILTPTTSSFEYVSQDNVLSISSLTHVAADQLITIKGHLHHLNATKKVLIQGVEVKKEGYINDPTGYIKIVFWGKHTDKQQEGQTDMFLIKSDCKTIMDKNTSTPQNRMKIAPSTTKKR